MASGSISSREDLEVWQVAMLLAEQCYELTGSFPREEMYGLTSQIRRAAVSVPSNIAEGYGRDQTGNFVQFLKIAQGSLREFETQLALSVRLKLASQQKAAQTKETSVRVSKMLRALIRRLETGTARPPRS